MDIHIYAGPPRTASHHISSIIEQNAELLKSQGICVVGMAQQLPALKVAIDEISKGVEKEVVYENFIQKLTQGKKYKRVVIFDHRLLGSALTPVRNSMVLHAATKSLLRFTRILPEGSYRFFFATRNLTTFLPSCYSCSLNYAKVNTFEDFIAGTNVQKARWSETIGRLTHKLPKDDLMRDHVVTWRYEDYPKIWRDVVGGITGVENCQDLQGTSAPVNEGLTLYGSQLMYKYLQKNTPKNQGDYKKVGKAFLEKFSTINGVSGEPFWSESEIEKITFAYEDDWYYIERMDQVATISARQVF